METWSVRWEKTAEVLFPNPLAVSVEFGLLIPAVKERISTSVSVCDR